MKKLIAWLCKPVPWWWLALTLALWVVFAVLLVVQTYPIRG